MLSSDERISAASCVVIALGACGIVVDQRGNGIQRVEKKMRLHLDSIDASCASAASRRASRFIPLLGAERELGRIEPRSQLSDDGEEHAGRAAC